jgi:hypothetical protein
MEIFEIAKIFIERKVHSPSGVGDLIAIAALLVCLAAEVAVLARVALLLREFYVDKDTC